MSYLAKSPHPVRIPETMRESLTFAWPADPGSDSPGGYVGDRAGRFIGAPIKYRVAPPGFTGQSAFTCFWTMTFSGAMTSTLNVPYQSGFAGPGFEVQVRSGQVFFTETDSAGGLTSLQANRSTASGTVLHCAVVHQPFSSYFALYIDGTLAHSRSDPASWSVQNSASIGSRTDGLDVYSHGLRDVYFFSRGFSPEEIRRVTQGLP